MVSQRGPLAVERRPFVVACSKSDVAVLIFLRRLRSSCMPAQGKRPAKPIKQVSHDGFTMTSLMCSRQVPLKKHKATHNEISFTRKSESTGSKVYKGKRKALERKYIPIPVTEATNDEDEGIQLSDQDLDVLRSASFLKQLDHKGIARSGPLEPLRLNLTSFSLIQEQN